MQISRFRLAYCLLVVGLAACSGPRVEILDRPVEANKTARAFTSSTALETGNRKTLREEKLLRLYNRDHRAAIKELAARFKEEPSRERQLALAEMSSDYADVLAKTDPVQSAGRYLDAAWLTHEAALSTVMNHTESPEGIIYDYSSARVVRLIRDWSQEDRQKGLAQGSLMTWKVSVGNEKGMVDPEAYDLVVPSNRLKTDGIKWKSITQDGLGGAMVGHTIATEERREADPQMPVAGRGFPLNARIEFKGNEALIVLQDLMDGATVELEGKEIPLGGNFSSAVSFSYYDKVRRMNKLKALLRPAEFADTMGLFSLRPFDPDRIPLVLVHGLMSSAEAWYPFINLLLADPVIRERYQILVFNYPSGVPIGKSRSELAEALKAYQMRNDPERSHPLMRRMVIVGHSMGGIISNAQVRTSGERVYDTVFTKDLDELNLSESQEDEIESLAYFKANPDITRAILLAAPLRGSAFASNRIGQLGAFLIRLPFDVVDSVFGQIEAVDALTDIAQKASVRPTNSVTSLRPDNPTLEVILECPVNSKVQIHSIVAQKDPDVPKEEGTDGFVPYSSSHLDEAVSEVVVMDADHRGMVNREETIREVSRILRLHAEAD